MTSEAVPDLTQESRIEGIIQHEGDEGTATLRIFDRGQHAEVIIPEDDIELPMMRAASDDPATLIFTAFLQNDESE